MVPSPNELALLIKKDINKIKVGYIPNAQDHRTGDIRSDRVKAIFEYLCSLGLKVTTIDLREYSDHKLLKHDLSKFDLIWACGGNSFNLRYEMKRSGFENIIRELLEDGIVYGGDSAGAAVVGNTLKGIEIADQPELAKEIIWNGIGLTDHFILPHVNSPGIGKIVDQIADIHKDDKTMIKLNDAQAFIIDGESEHIVG